MPWEAVFSRDSDVQRGRPPRLLQECRVMGAGALSGACDGSPGGAGGAGRRAAAAAKMGRSSGQIRVIFRRIW